MAISRGKMKRRPAKNNAGQSTIEYLLMVGFGALFAVQVATFFNGVFRDGFAGLERNVEREVASGQGYP